MKKINIVVSGFNTTTVLGIIILNDLLKLQDKNVIFLIFRVKRVNISTWLRYVNFELFAWNLPTDQYAHQEGRESRDNCIRNQI